MDPAADSPSTGTHQQEAAAGKADNKPSSEAPPASTETQPQTGHPTSDPPPTAQKSVTWSTDLTNEVPPPPPYDAAPDGGLPPEAANPYIASSPVAADSSSEKKTLDTVKNVLGRWGKKIGESAKKAEDLSRNTWQHLKTGPSFAEAAMGRIAQGTKLIAEGGSDKIFRQTFDTLTDEKLRNSYACYLSTSAGPVMGMLYLSTEKLAFCSDNPLSYKVGDKTEWSYYKVVIPLHQLRAANPSMNRTNSSEKYIQVVSVDNHEFWFMGFLNYNNAVKSLQESVRHIHEAQV